MDNEDIKILEEEIREFKEFEKKYKLKKINKGTEGKKRIQAIQNIIARYKELEDLYNKEKIKNRNVEMLRIACLSDNAKMVVMYKDDFNRNWRNDFIPKSKVKEKIEELEKSILNENASIEQFYKLKFYYEILQELLEED